MNICLKHFAVAPLRKKVGRSFSSYHWSRRASSTASYVPPSCFASSALERMVRTGAGTMEWNALVSDDISVMRRERVRRSGLRVSPGMRA